MAGPGRALGGSPGGRGGGDTPLAMIRRGIEALKLELNVQGEGRRRPNGSAPPPGRETGSMRYEPWQGQGRPAAERDRAMGYGPARPQPNRNTPLGGALGMPKLIGGELRLPPRRTTNTKEYQDYQDWADAGSRYVEEIGPIQHAPPHMRPSNVGNALNMPRLWGE